MSRPVIYVGGTGRCGSNLLKQLLSQGPRTTSLPFEPRYVIDPDGVLDFLRRTDTWCPFTIDNAIDRLSTLLSRLGKRTVGDRMASAVSRVAPPPLRRRSLRPYAAWELDAWIPGFYDRSQQLIADLSDVQYEGTWCGAGRKSRVGKMAFFHFARRVEIRQMFSCFIRDNVASLLDSKAAEYLVDDSTFSVIFSRELQELLPESRFIHIYRDPRDVVYSYLSQRWTPSSVADAVDFYLGVIGSARQSIASLQQGTYVEIRFEDLLCSPSEVLDRLASELGLPRVKCVPSDLRVDRIGRWRRVFRNDEPEFRRLHSICAELGYPE